MHAARCIICNGYILVGWQAVCVRCTSAWNLRDVVKRVRVAVVGFEKAHGRKVRVVR